MWEGWPQERRSAPIEARAVRRGRGNPALARRAVGAPAAVRAWLVEERAMTRRYGSRSASRIANHAQLAKCRLESVGELRFDASEAERTRDGAVGVHTSGHDNLARLRLGHVVRD